MIDNAPIESLHSAFCQAVNAVKRVMITPDTIKPDQYLGGDLGIDSVEMLEIWFRIETAFAIKILDKEKRDIYTVGEVLGVVSRSLPTK